MPGFLVVRHGALTQVESIDAELVAEVVDGDAMIARVGPETNQFETFETDGEGEGEWCVVDEE